MKLGIIGLGAISPFFLRAVDQMPELDLVAACDRDPERLSHVRDVAPFTEAAALLRESGVEAVILTLPNHLHHAVTVAALEQGVHVCCEKPLAMSLAEAQNLVDRADAHGVTLFTAFHRRYNSNVERLRSQLPHRQRIRRVRARYGENIGEHTGGDTWYLDASRCGGGCLMDNGPNVLDTLWHLMGPLQVVDATLGDVRSGCEFAAEVRLRTPDGIDVEMELDWALETGEMKDVTVELDDGTLLTADMLAGYPTFKGSLDHEYRAIMADFVASVSAPEFLDRGVDIVRLVEDSYRHGRCKEHRLRMQTAVPACSKVVRLLFHHRDDRGMVVAPWQSRCLRAGELHELVSTVDRPQHPGDRVDRVGFLGFVEMQNGAVVSRGDEVVLGERVIGRVAGFDECHYPNHYNILVDTETVLGAGEVDLRLGDDVVFRAAP